MHLSVLTWLWMSAPKTLQQPDLPPQTVDTIVELSSPIHKEVAPSSSASPQPTPQSDSDNNNSVLTTTAAPASTANTQQSIQHSTNSITPSNQNSTAPTIEGKANQTHPPSAANSPSSSASIAAASSAPLRNEPLTRAMNCPAFAQRQSIAGQVVVHVSISINGSVKNASINTSKDRSMNELALTQAKQLKFPTMKNSAGETVESFSEVKLTYDCRNS